MFTIAIKVVLLVALHVILIVRGVVEALIQPYDEIFNSTGCHSLLQLNLLIENVSFKSKR